MSDRPILLPDDVYQGLLAAAHASGVTPADWIATHLPKSANASKEFEPAAVEHLFGAFDSRKYSRPPFPSSPFEEAVVEKMTKQGLHLP